MNKKYKKPQIREMNNEDEENNFCLRGGNSLIEPCVTGAGMENACMTGTGEGDPNMCMNGCSELIE